MNRDVGAFFKSVALGTIATGGPFLLVTVPLAISDAFQPMAGKTNVAGDVYLAALPILVSLATVLVGSVVIGIPATLILRRQRWENQRHYLSIGAVAGFLIPLLGLLISGAEWAVAGSWGLLGAFGGLVTAHTWSKETKQPA